MLKKVLSLTVATALMASAIIFPASASTLKEGDKTTAKNGDFIQLKNGDTMKVFDSFETSEAGHLIGTNKDPLYLYDGNKDNAVSKVSIEAMGENNSNALVFATKDNFGQDSKAYCQPEYEGTNEKNVVNNFEGANALGFWVDTTDCITGTGNVTAEFLFGEQDCDENGNLELNAKNQPAGSEYTITDTGATYYIQNPDGSWKEMQNSKSSWLDIPQGYQGYIKIPFDSYELTWGQDDDNKIDLKNVMSAMVAYGIWSKNIGHKGLVIDNIGFFGSYPGAVETTTTPETCSSGTAGTVITTAPTTASTTIQEAATTAAPTENPTDTAAPETTGTAANQNPKTGGGSALPALLITAAAAAALTLMKKKVSNTYLK